MLRIILYVGTFFNIFLKYFCVETAILAEIQSIQYFQIYHLIGLKGL